MICAGRNLRLMSAVHATATQGVDFPLTGEAGTLRWSTSAFGRSVVAAAFDGVDAVGAAAAARDWRSGYLPHFARLVEAGLVGPDAAVTIAAKAPTRSPVGCAASRTVRRLPRATCRCRPHPPTTRSG